VTDDELNAIKARLYNLQHAKNAYEKHDAYEALHANAEGDLEALIAANDDLRRRLDTLAELLDAADEVLAGFRADAQLDGTKGEPQ